MMNNPITFPSALLLEGVVDGITNHIVHGWAWFPDEPARTASIEVRAHGTVLGRGEADTMRADLAAAGKRNGYCAFALRLEATLPEPGTALEVVAVQASGAQPLVGSPVVMPAAASAESSDILPIPLHRPGLHGSLDQCGPARMRGWLRWTDGTQASPNLVLREGSREWMRFAANQWRPDIAELHQGDGCCGFDQPLPDELRDDRLHELRLCLADEEASPLAMPFRALTSPASPEKLASRAKLPPPLSRQAVADPVTLSIVVNFYNMQREAARTLTSLTRAYQADSADLDYEVLCIDNGSRPPLDPAWVASFGPEFRLVRPSRQHASPCGALNEAALAARGKYLAVMIDGAHVLSPGIFREARQAWREHAGAVVAVRHWFIGGDQRWLTLVGYSREQEDKLFERIRWPLNGYDLFRIGTPMSENPEPWFDGLSESNCLMLPTELYDRIGGFDEAFDQPGGGFANLDLWRRTCMAASAPLVAPIGEATFHQFHGGTTTNVDDVEKDLRVRAYATAYRTLRGEDFAMIERGQLTFRGQLRSEFATGMRQRTLMPMRLGVTDEVRPGKLAAHFDDGAQSHLLSVYAECGLQRDVRWLGQATGMAPADLSSVQDIIHQIRPDAVIGVGVERGLIAYVDSVLQAAGIGGARILHVADDAVTASARITGLVGTPANADAPTAARLWAGTAETVLVLHAAGDAGRFNGATLAAWGKLVSHRSYMICVGTVFGQPWLGYSTRQHYKTLREFTEGNPMFVIDRSWTRQLITTCPYGYLRKIGGGVNAASYDAALDELGTDTSLDLENMQ